MATWKVEDSAGGLRLSPVTRRGLGSRELTWADLLHVELSAVRVYALYFPSRFDLEVDSAAQAALESFGCQTGVATSVNFWDSTDPEFSRALSFFDLGAPPALVLAAGLKSEVRRELDRANIYAIAITDSKVLSDRERLASAVNGAHEVLVRGDPQEIARYVRERSVVSLIAAIGRISERLRDEFLRFKPKFQLPGGISVQVG